MACCEYHNRLGSKQHSVEYTSGDCGSLKLETLTALVPGIAASAPILNQNRDTVSPDAVAYYDEANKNKDAAIGYGKPDYCCFRCPTLLASLGVAGETEPKP